MPINSYYDDDNGNGYNYRNYERSPSSVRLRQSELMSLDKRLSELYMTPKEGYNGYKSPPRGRSKDYRNYEGQARNRYDDVESDDDIDERSYRRKGYGEFEEEEEENYSPILDPSDIAQLDPSTILRDYPPELSNTFDKEKRSNSVTSRNIYKDTRSISRESRDDSRRRSIRDQIYDSIKRSEKDPISVVDNLHTNSLVERERITRPSYSPSNRRILDDLDKENVEMSQRRKSLIPGTSPDLRKESPPSSMNKNNPFKYPLSPPKSSPDLIRKIAPTDVRNENDDDLKRYYEEQLRLIKKSERERSDALERDYRAQLGKVQKDLDQLLRQQEHLESVKTDMTHVLEEEIQDLKIRLEDEQEMHQKESDDLRTVISRLKGQIEELKQRKSIFDEDEMMNNSEKRRLIKEYEQKMTNLKREHDLRVTQLINQFEQEKKSAMDIMKTRIKTELSLIIPKLKQQFKDTYTQSISKARMTAESNAQRKYEQALRSLKEEHLRDKEQSLKDLKVRYELERREWQEKLKEKYELRLMQARNECERQILNRLKTL